MTKRAIITQRELMRLAEVAKATGPAAQPKSGYVNGIDYSRPVL